MCVKNGKYGLGLAVKEPSLAGNGTASRLDRQNLTA